MSNSAILIIINFLIIEELQSQTRNRLLRRMLALMKKRSLQAFETSMSMSHQRLGDMSRIGMNMLAYKGNVPDVRKFGVAERLSRTFRAESKRLHAEAPKMLWADTLSTTYLIYRIPYVSIRLRISKEEWRGNGTSLVHLKVFGCDLFVKVKDVCREAMKCTFIGIGSDEIRYSFRDTKSHQKIQVVLVEIPENLADNNSIVIEHGLSSEITQSSSGSLDTRRLRDSIGTKIQQRVQGSSKTCSLVRLPARKKESQSLWMFKVQEEQDGYNSCEDDYNQVSLEYCSLRGLASRVVSRQPSYMVTLMKISTCTIRGFSVIWERRKPSVQVEENIDVYQVGDEKEVKVLRSFNSTPSELITKDGVLPE
nr:retrovirus-related Pol polyprotein from transposon TNT 1-94 [Tanacetum cinerariifolium]